jgi:hypothetical protein
MSDTPTQEPDVPTRPDDYLNPQRLMRAAVARIEEALHEYDQGGAGPDVLAALEKAHYRIETAQREIAGAFTDGNVPEAWTEVADAVQMDERAARRRFTASAWLGR